MLSQDAALLSRLPVRIVSQSILISSTFSSSTVVFAVTEASPFLAVISYSPLLNLAVPLNVAVFLSSLQLHAPDCSVEFLVIVKTASAGTAFSNTASNVSALVALKLVIAPSI